MIYIGQTALKIEFLIYEIIGGRKTPIDLTGCSVALMRDGNALAGTTSIKTPETSGIVEWQPTDENTINESGTWEVQPEVTFSDGKNAKGEPYQFTVKN